MKKLVIKEIPNDQGVVDKIQIVEQTHRNEQFSDKIFPCYTHVSYFNHNGFSLVSEHRPFSHNHRQESIQSNSALYVRGSWKQKDNEIIIIPNITYLENLRTTIFEYNKYFADCEGCTERHCNSCEVNQRGIKLK